MVLTIALLTISMEPTPGGGGGGAFPVISHIGMRRPNGYGFWAVFTLKTGIHVDFAHFDLELGMVSRRSYGCESMCSSF